MRAEEDFGRCVNFTKGFNIIILKEEIQQSDVSVDVTVANQQ